MIQKAGFDVVRHQRRKSNSWEYPLDFDTSKIEICEAVQPYTMTSPERVNAVIQAVRYVVSHEIGGAMVECGVWKGGSSMAMALTLMEMGGQDRDLYLYDTFSGMSTPTDVDVSIKGARAHRKFMETRVSEDVSEWCLSPLDEVRENVYGTGYDRDRVHFVKGKVEDTIPDTLPGEIALLRLDTDWYESTKHEMIHLFPLLKKGGVLIVDDYGHWEGARRAVDEYIAEKDIRILLNRIDYTGRIAIKVE